MKNNLQLAIAILILTTAAFAQSVRVDNVYDGDTTTTFSTICTNIGCNTHVSQTVDTRDYRTYPIKVSKGAKEYCTAHAIPFTKKNSVINWQCNEAYDDHLEADVQAEMHPTK